MRPCSSSGMDRRILLYTRFPAGVVRPFDGTTRFRRLFSVGSCFWFSNGSPETLRTLCDKPASLFLGASWGQLSLTPHFFKRCRHRLRTSKQSFVLSLCHNEAEGLRLYLGIA
jgi:hypothetical protein